MNGGLPDPLRLMIVRAGLAEGVLVSPISAWEVGLLARSPRSRSPRLLPDPQTWFARLMALPIVRLAMLSPAIAIEASFLPEPLHRDPADRLLIATARHLNVPLVTRDARILAYAAAGHLKVLAC